MDLPLRQLTYILILNGRTTKTTDLPTDYLRGIHSNIKTEITYCLYEL